MKYISNLLVVVAVLCFAMLPSTVLFAQEWSAEQKEVWENVEAYWVLYTEEDLEGFLSYFHTDFSGWFNLAALPRGKSSVRKWDSHGMKTEDTVVHEINPVAIKIFGNVAVVHYYYTRAVKDAEGKQTLVRGRWTDILMKQDDRWVMIGDHGGPASN
jgi:ketosteroid isomerase-like protein